MRFSFVLSILTLMLALPLGRTVNAQVVVPNSDGIDARADANAIAARLGSPDAFERQKAAEALATLAAVSQKKLIEGYRLQEKDKKVRLALDWALYRIGKQESLFQIIMELDSGRHDQAVGYLSQLDTPAPLNDILKRERDPRITTGVIQALGRIGDAQSLELIKPFRDSFAPGVAGAAEVAFEAIEQRLAQTETVMPSRPRTISKDERPDSP
jgi:hypothetical protein